MTEKATKPGVRTARVRMGGTGVYTPPPPTPEPKTETEKEKDDGQRPKD